MTTSRRIVDILIQSPDGDTIAVVEVKNLRNLSPDEATQIRRNLADFGVPVHVPFFMLLSQDVGFLWKDSKYENLDAPPMYTFPMENVVARYSDRKPGERLYEAEFEILALRWLNQLTIKSHNSDEEPEKTLALSGFDEAIKGAYALFEAEA
ncbi:MAG: hypothetical protein ACRDIV_19755 [Ktedonobacteraceae bacterium]